MASIAEVSVPGTRVSGRLYRPVSEDGPTLVFLHGGMWIAGDLDTHDRFCRQLADGANVNVLAVDYRRAPENPWPDAVDDAVATIRWAADDLAGMVAVGGDSAGGCIAALAGLRLRDDGCRLLAAQVLICPNTDLTCRLATAGPRAGGWGLEAEDVREAAEMWVPNPVIRVSGQASPLHAERLDGLPPTAIITAENDPLRAEGDAYARRLTAAGVPTTHRCEPDLPHGFIQESDPESEAADNARKRLFIDVARLLGTHEQAW